MAMKDFRNFSLIIRKLYINNPRLSVSSSDSHFQSNNSNINASRPSDSPADSHFQSNNSKVKFFSPLLCPLLFSHFPKIVQADHRNIQLATHSHNPRLRPWKRTSQPLVTQTTTWGKRTPPQPEVDESIPTQSRRYQNPLTGMKCLPGKRKTGINAKKRFRVTVAA